MPAIPKIVHEHTVLGLDIGTKQIKLVEMRSTRAGIEVLSAAARPTPPEVISNGVIVDPQILGNAVRQLVTSQGIRTKTVVASVSGQSSLVVRPIEVLKMSRADLAETMRWEVERHIPFHASEVIMDYQPLIDPDELPATAQNMEVLLAVAQEDMVNAYLDTLNVARLEPVALDVEPLCTCRSLIDINADEGTYQETVALVNIGGTTTDITVIKEGLLSFTRPINLAGDKITEAISEAMGKDTVEAERLKVELGQVFLEPLAPPELPERADKGAPAAPPRLAEAAALAAAAPPSESEEEKPTPVFDLSSELEEELPPARPKPPVYQPAAGQSLVAPTAPGEEESTRELVRTPDSAGDGAVREVYQAMLPTLAELVTEVRRSLEYYRTRYPNSEVGRIILLGGTARLPNLDRFLANELGMRVDVADPLRRFSLAPSLQDPSLLEQIRCTLPVAVGLALRDMID